MTVSELYDIWVDEKSETADPSTIKCYNLYRRFICDKFGELPVNDITLEEWEKFEQELPSARKANDNSKTITKSTVRQALNIYHAMFHYGKIKFGLNDPAEDIELSSKDMYVICTFTSKEVATLRKAMKPFDIYQLCIMLCLYTGIDADEICAAHWGDIDINKRLIKIRRAIARKKTQADNDKPIYEETELTSNKARRDLPIPSWIADQLEIMKPMHEDGELLVAGPRGEISPGTFKSRYMSFLKTADVKHQRPSALRHTFAMTCKEKGMDLKTLSELLGHANTSITLRMYYGKQTRNVRKFLEGLYDE